MSYFNHSFCKVFIATKASQALVGTPGTPGDQAEITDGILTSTGIHVSELKSSAAAEGYQLGVGTAGFFDSATHLSTDAAGIVAANGAMFYFAGASIKLDDKQGPFHGGYQEAHKSKGINPRFISKTWKADPNAATRAVVNIGGVSGAGACAKDFYCGEDYNLRLEVKGHDALRFANHMLYQTFQANGGCCADPEAAPVVVDSTTIYKQWATAIAEDPYFKDFVRPILVVTTGTVTQSYAYDAASAIAEGLDPATELFEHAGSSDNNNEAGIVLLGAYTETKFGDCTFQTSDYYSVEPLKIYASEVDLEGDPCAFEGLCVVTECQGVQANGLGETKLRALILSESYLQNFMANDLRIREITQGDRSYAVLSRDGSYSSFYIQHSIPVPANPSGMYSADQYVLEIVGTAATSAYLESEMDDLITGGVVTAPATEDYTVTGCTPTALPNP